MKIISTIGLLTLLGLGLSACSQMPKECEKTWEQMESIAKSSGIAADAIKEQKKAFETHLKDMSKDQAIKTCEQSSAALTLGQSLMGQTK